MSALPAYHCGHGGMDQVASAVSSRTSPSTSAPSQASMYSLEDPSLFGVRNQRRERPTTRAVCFDRRACTLERAVGGGSRGLHGCRRLEGRQAEHVAQQQHRPLPRRQLLKGRDECQPHRLARLVARLRARMRIAHELESARPDTVRPRRQPPPARRAGQRRPPGRVPPAAFAGRASDAPGIGGRRSWRSGRANREPNRDPGMPLVPATRAGGPPGRRPRPRGRSPIGGSSAGAAAVGADGRARRTATRRGARAGPAT